MKCTAFLAFLLFSCSAAWTRVEETSELVVDKLPTGIFAWLGSLLSPIGAVFGALFGDTLSDAVESGATVEEQSLALDEAADEIRELKGQLADADRVKTAYDLGVTILEGLQSSLPWIVGGLIVGAIMMWVIPSPFKRKKS